MGLVKAQMMREMERGYGSSDQVVCHNCVGDYYLKEYINNNGEQSRCNYCNSNSVCIPLENLMEAIMNGILQEYEYANDSMGYCGKEGGFIGAETFDSYDLIRNEIGMELDFQCSELYDDVSDLMNDDVWCQKDPYGSLRYDEDFYTWEMYAERLKKADELTEMEMEPDDEIRLYTSPDEILMRISEGVKKLELIEEIPSNTALWRARAHNESDVINSAATLGAPREEQAGCNRMNPAKVSTFYGAFDKYTALAEIAGKEEPIRTVGVFYNQVPLKVINLGKIRGLSMPSLFDVDNSDRRILLMFLKRFNREISKPIEEGKEKEYLPTQKLIEYLSDELSDANASKINGAIYTSSRLVEGLCCSLFIGWEQCSDNKDKILWLDDKSLERIVL
ncbi:RES domain-containing protein [Propionispira arboris]|uniref:RES domain-containing protein n=1 Tax=Propionispira arboris TaxID=84035 RepID=A0A1H6UWM0_9FIRM|nr:HEPN-associated N-terminal domain-containing protein [Propionispira arboris]SEI94047.1 RES domain-containing protein [Propionispira arboris]